MKPGGESSSEPREGVGPGAGPLGAPGHDVPLLFPPHWGGRKGSAMPRSPQNTPPAMTDTHTQESIRQSCRALTAAHK